MMCPDIQMRKLRLRQAWSFVEGSGGGGHTASPLLQVLRGVTPALHIWTALHSVQKTLPPASFCSLRDRALSVGWVPK